MAIDDVLQASHLRRRHRLLAQAALRALDALAFKAPALHQSVAALQRADTLHAVQTAAFHLLQTAIAHLEHRGARDPGIARALSRVSLLSCWRALRDAWSDGSLRTEHITQVHAQLAAIGPHIAALPLTAVHGMALGNSLLGLDAALTLLSLAPTDQANTQWLAHRAQIAPELAALHALAQFHHQRLSFHAMRFGGIAASGARRYQSALRRQRRRDPLAIDLNGNGIETVGIGTHPVLFDHDANGIRTGTGWLAASDGWLVLDRDGNGRIDSGRELFGEDTLLAGTEGDANAVFARDGFEALRLLDTNGDDTLDAADPAYHYLQIWQDLNQDGISQSGELARLSQHGIRQIHLVPSPADIPLGNGNAVRGSASLQSGPADASSTARTVYHLALASAPYYRAFTDLVPHNEAARNLPEVPGSGRVRDLREAMSLGSPAAQALTEHVAQLAQATSKYAQQSLLDRLLQHWADTAPAARSAVEVPQDPPAAFRLQHCVPILEAFNGHSVRPHGGGGALRLSTFQARQLNQAYDALRESLYQHLVVQTRLRPYLQSMPMQYQAQGLYIDTREAAALLITKVADDPCGALQDAADLVRYAALTAIGWDLADTLAALLDSVESTPTIADLLLEERIVQCTEGSNSYLASNAHGEIVLGNAADNVVVGSPGADTLYGQAGQDILHGRRGNDTLCGGADSDTYRLERGDGQDTIVERGPGGGLLDRLQMGDSIALCHLQLRQVDDQLCATVLGSQDQAIIPGWYGASGQQIEEIRTGDGTTILNTQVDALVQAMATFAPLPAGASRWSQAQTQTLQALLLGIPENSP